MSADRWRVGVIGGCAARSARAAGSAPAAVAALAAVATLLASCQSAPTRVFTLDAIVSATRAAGYAGPAIRVDAVQVPPAWDRLELLQATGHGEWRIDDLDRWAAPLGQLMREALTADLRQRLPPDLVIFPSLPKPPGALGLRIDVLDFRAAASGGRLEASWLVTPAGADRAAPVVTAFPADAVPAVAAAPVVTAFPADAVPAVAAAPVVTTAHSIVLNTSEPADGPAATARSLAELLARLADAIVAQLNADAALSTGSH